LTIAAGTLLIGVHDEQYAVGIEPDMRSVKGKNVDGFELKLREMIKTRFEPRPYSQVDVRFPAVDGKTVCRVDARPDGDIFHLDGKVYIRHGNSTEELSGVTLTQWIERRSKSAG
jgi:predicted HTH transcriptional regulator